MQSIRHGLCRSPGRPRIVASPGGSAVLPRKHAFHSTGVASLHADRVEVGVGSSGSISLECAAILPTPPPTCSLTRPRSIHHPPSPSPNAPAIVYLPPGPLLTTPAPPAPRLATLATAANVTVVRVNYRLDAAAHRYPRPVHDAAAGYDWVVRHLVRGDNGHRDLDKAFGRVGLCGELLGGGLAAALALTECHARRAGVRAAVLGNPVADWTAMYPVAAPGAAAAPPTTAAGAPRARTARTRKAAAATAKSSWEAFAHGPALPAAALLRARHALFAAPEDYFDPFASPLLFFKTAATAVPPRVDPIDEVFAAWDLSLRAFERKRRSARRHPGPDGRLRLPAARVWVGAECVLKDQGIELAQSVARSNNLYGGPDGKGEGTGWERVEVQVREGLGLWGERELLEMGQWFGRVLRIDQP